MDRISLVTAPTLLGSLLVERLAARGRPVRALLVRQPRPHPLETVPGCRVFTTDARFSTGLDAALDGVDTLFHLTVLLTGYRRHWEQTVVAPTVERTRRVLEAAADRGVRRVVLESCYICADYMHRSPWTAESWNERPVGYYDRARTLAERAAWEVALRRGLEMVSLLPARMIGPFAFGGRLTASVALLDSILWNRPFPLDMGLFFNFVDARRTADAHLAAAEQGEPGRRYLLANDRFVSMEALYAIAAEFNPRARRPWQPGRSALRRMARLNVALSGLTGAEPFILPELVDTLYRVCPQAGAAEARQAFGFEPGDPEALAREVFAFLAQRRLTRKEKP